MAHALENQHEVPQFYLKRFLAPSKRLFVFDKVTGEVQEKPTAEVACGSSLYDFSGEPIPGHDHQIVEKTFSALESEAAKAYNGLLKGLRNSRKFSPAQRKQIAFFIALQFLRTKNFRTAIEQAKEKISQRLLDALAMQQGFKPGDFKATPNPIYAPLSHASFMFNDDARTAEKLATCFNAYIWTFWESTSGRPFYTSDNPVQRCPHIQHPMMGSGFTSPGMEVLFPLSTRFALRMFEPRSFRAVADWEGTLRQMSDFEVQRCNASQVYQSNQFVFCSADDFDTAREVILQYPEAADPSRSRWQGTYARMFWKRRAKAWGPHARRSPSVR